MKIWTGYGTEHSANLVIVGTFKTVEDAAQATKIIEDLTKIVRSDESKGLIAAGGSYSKFSETLLNYLSQTNFCAVDYNDPEMLLYDFDLQQNGNKINIHTEECKFQILLNVMIQKGAKVEIFSAHDYKCSYSRND